MRPKKYIKLDKKHGYRIKKHIYVHKNKNNNNARGSVALSDVKRMKYYVQVFSFFPHSPGSCPTVPKSYGPCSWLLLGPPVLTLLWMNC